MIQETPRDALLHRPHIVLCLLSILKEVQMTRFGEGPVFQVEVIFLRMHSLGWTLSFCYEVFIKLPVSVWQLELPALETYL